MDLSKNILDLTSKPSSENKSTRKKLAEAMKLNRPKRESKSKADRSIVTFEHQGLNQRGEVVCSCVRGAMMMRQPS